MSMLPEILFNVPGTAHCLGGCVIADSPSDGVVDYRNRVFGYRNMYICDGSVVSANLGVNPSLTITALAERAMSFIPPASEQGGTTRPSCSAYDLRFRSLWLSSRAEPRDLLCLLSSGKQVHAQMPFLAT